MDQQMEQQTEHQANHEDHPYAVKTLLAWHAPGRPFIKRTKEYYATSILITLLLVILCALFQQWMLILLIVSFLFAVFALSSVPPHNFHYKITTEGIIVEDHAFLWQELYDFYVKRFQAGEVIQVRTIALIPGEITLTMGEMSIDQVKHMLLPYLPFREIVKPTLYEKLANWLAKTFPLERKKVAQ